MFAKVTGKVTSAVNERLGRGGRQDDSDDGGGAAAEDQTGAASASSGAQASPYPTTAGPEGAPPPYSKGDDAHGAPPGAGAHSAYQPPQPSAPYPQQPPGGGGGAYPPPQQQPAYPQYPQQQQQQYPQQSYPPQPQPAYPQQPAAQPQWVNHPSTAVAGTGSAQQQQQRSARGGESFGLAGKFAALFSGTVASATTAISGGGGGGGGSGRRVVSPAGASSTTPLNRNGAGMPRPAAAGRKADDTNKPIQTVLGVHNGVALCVREQARALRSRRPADAAGDCCYMTMGQAVTESLRQNLCCLCFFLAFVACRVATAFVVAPTLMVLNTLVAVALIVPTSYYAVSEVCAAKCLGPWTKAFTLIGAPILSVLSVVTVLLWSLGNGVTIPFDYCMADSLQLSYLGAVGMATTGLAQRKAVFTHYSRNPDLPYWDIRPWAPIAALLGIVLGLALCAVAYLFIALLLSPKLVYTLVADLWKEPLFGTRDRAPRHSIDDPCYQLCMCIFESAQDLCAVCDVFFRVVMSFFMFVGVILFIPVACLIGLVEGGIAGADGWNDPRAIVMSPVASVQDFYARVLEWANIRT